MVKKTNKRKNMKKPLKSCLWFHDIIRLNGYFENSIDKKSNKDPNGKNLNCNINKDSCPLSKTKFVKGTGRYVYWNYKPKMIIDLDWIELNSKQPINVILVEKRKT